MSSSMDVSVRLEGGLGDCLLGNRFVSAIKEKYPNSSITAYIDSEGKTFQKEALDILYPSMYKDIKVIPKKKHKEFWIDCQFGQDNYYGALENVPDDIKEEMEKYDKFYDLHIDSLKWLDYDFDWLRYFKFFPKPEFKSEYNGDKYIALHLVSSSSVGHRLEDWYIERLISELSKNYKCIVISTQDTNHFYDNIPKNKNIEIFNGSLTDALSIISNSSMMISTDSGFRYAAYGYSIPTLTFSANCPSPHSPVPSHMIRWLIYPETCYPLNYDFKKISFVTDNIMSGNRGYILTPFLSDFNNQAVKRIYKINKERTR